MALRSVFASHPESKDGVNEERVVRREKKRVTLRGWKERMARRGSGKDEVGHRRGISEEVDGQLEKELEGLVREHEQGLKNGAG